MSHWSTLSDGQAETPVSAPATSAAGGRFFLLGDERGDSAPAYDSLLGRKVLLRFVGETGALPGPLAAVLGEAAALARLSHPNLVKVHDVGVLDDRPFVAMELVDGMTLGKWQAGGPRRASEILEVITAAASGLAAAHALGIAHGGISADQIAVDGDRVLLTGFGSSTAAALDLASDVRALGGVLFSLVHGRPPGDDPPAPPGDRGLARLHRVALRALGPDPPSAEALASTLAADPARRTRRHAVAVVGAVAVLGAFGAGAYLAWSPERRCLAGSVAIADVWNDGRRTELTRRYAALPVAAARWATLARKLDQYRDEWRDAFAQVCRGTYGWRRVPDPLFDRRMRCLTGGRVSVEALLSSLAVATPDQLTAAAALEPDDIGRCARIDRPERKPPPSDSRSRADLEKVERLLSRSLAQHDLAAYGAAVATAGEAVQVARALGHDPTLARALLREASAIIDTGGRSEAGPEFDRAAQLLQEAYSAADRGEDDDDRLGAASEMLTLQNRRESYVEGDRWAVLAEALLTREGIPPVRATQVETSIGYLRKSENRRVEAAAAFRKALEYAEKIVPPEPRRIALTQSSICQVIDDVPEHIACARRSLEAERSALGADNPEIALDEAILAEALASQPSTHAEGCRMFRKARATMADTVDPAHPNAVAIVAQLAECLAYEDEVPEARRLLEELIAHHPGPLDLAAVQDLHAYVETRHGSLAAASRDERDALAGFRELLAPCDERIVTTASALAAVLARRGEWAEAQRVSAKALATCAKVGVENAATADLRARQGLVLLEQGRFEPALRVFQDAERRHRKLGSDDHALAFTLHGMGAALFGVGRTDEALAALERGYRARPAPNDPAPELAADLALALAHALRSRDQERACALGREAASGYRRMSTFAHELQQTERWLARQGCAPRS